MQTGKVSNPPKSHRLIYCPYKVLVDDEQIDEFYDVRDAIASARALKREQPNSDVSVSDQPSGRLVVKI